MGETVEKEVFAFPASFAQQRLWFLDQVAPGTATYNIPQAFRLKGPVKPEVVSKSLRDMVRRHEALRTTFEAEEGQPMQVVDESRDLDVRQIDLSVTMADASIEEREAEALRLAREDARTPFDLEKDLLLRSSLIKLADDDWVLVLNVHHIVCDGWSLAVFFTEFTTLYNAYAADAASPLDELDIQYADYAIWQREWLEGEELDKQVSFWKEALAGELSILELPGDRTRPPEHRFRGAQLRFFLDPETTDAIVALGRKQGVSLFMTLMAAFKVFLSRISGQEEVLLGSPIANRDRAEIETAIGFYTNTVVFRTDLSGSPSFEELLLRVRDRALGVLANQDLPLEKVVEAVQPDRRSGDNPLFQVMFAVQKAPESAIDLKNIAATSMDVHSGTSKFDILLEMQELTRGMQCLFEYNTDIFDEDTAERLVKHFTTLIGNLVKTPDTAVDQVPLLTDDERQRILVEWNQTAADYDRGARLHDAFAARAAEHPDKVAIKVGDEALSYGELDRRANQVANYLKRFSLKPDELVGIFIERSSEMMVALLGVLKAGAAYLPLDPAYPSDRIQYMLKDAGSRVVLTQSHLVPDLPTEGLTFDSVRMDGDWDEIAACDAGAPDCPATRDNLAYQIYTSGSTGRPKGVQIPHGTVVNFIDSMAKEPGLRAEDTLLAVTTLSFDISVLELFVPLSVGATCFIATREEATDGFELMELLQKSAATVMQATPATWRMLIESDWEGKPDGDFKILCGGEALPPALAQELLGRCGSLWNMYGPTETTIWSTCAQVTDADNITIGKPIANTQIYILDKHLQPVPIGVGGDLYIAGDGVARGYHERPELTAERFITDPFAGEVDGASARMYKTGDLARFTIDGNIQYLQRSDNQVKVRGFRIELGEIETVLANQDAIRQAVVTVWDDGSGDKRLAAYIVYKEGESMTGSELRKALREDVPDYMVPHLFVELESIPLTDNGKVNRRALPDPLKQSTADDEEFLPPESAMEQLVAEIWREVLKLEQVGKRDNFYDLGGHSLLSTQMTYRLEKKTGFRLGPRSVVFQNLEQIAAECEQAVGAPAGDSAAVKAPAPAAAASAAQASAAGTNGDSGQPAAAQASAQTTSPSSSPPPSSSGAPHQPAAPAAATPASKAKKLSKRLFKAIKGRVLGS